MTSRGRRQRSIRFSSHALGYLARRGFTQAEVVNTIRQSPWQVARHGRLEATMDLPYNQLWNGIFYATKRVRPIFVVKPTEIVVVTVYTYFF